jgi:hypothetical protein
MSKRKMELDLKESDKKQCISDHQLRYNRMVEHLATATFHDEKSELCMLLRDELRQPPLEFALDPNQSIVQLLIDSNADPHQPAVVNWCKLTPLAVAAKNGCRHRCHTLLKNDVKVDIGGKIDYPVTRMTMNGNTVSIPRLVPTTPLREALKNNHIGVVRLLLEHDARLIHYVHPRGFGSLWTGTREILIAHQVGAHESMARVLLEHFEPTDLFDPDTVLANMVKWHKHVNADAYQLLIKHDAKCTYRALEFAIDGDRLELCNVFVKEGKIRPSRNTISALLSSDNIDIINLFMDEEEGDDEFSVLRAFNLRYNSRLMNMLSPRLLATNHMFDCRDQYEIILQTTPLPPQLINIIVNDYLQMPVNPRFRIESQIPLLEDQ